jgi:hypothetical protein
VAIRLLQWKLDLGVLGPSVVAIAHPHPGASKLLSLSAKVGTLGSSTASSLTSIHYCTNPEL